METHALPQHALDPWISSGYTVKSRREGPGIGHDEKVTFRGFGRSGSLGEQDVKCHALAIVLVMLFVPRVCGSVAMSRAWLIDLLVAIG